MGKITFGARLRELRKARDWTLRELSAACGDVRGCTLQNLSILERGESEPTLAVLRAIAAALGVSVGRLVD